MLVKFISFTRTRQNCAGLASNQCSVNKERIMEPFFCIRGITTWELILHPKIFNYIGSKKIKEERCLTWIGKTLLAERFLIIEASYYTIKGEKKLVELSGFYAQIFQHEYDHITGVKENFIGG